MLVNYIVLCFLLHVFVRHPHTVRLFTFPSSLLLQESPLGLLLLVYLSFSLPFLSLLLRQSHAQFWTHCLSTKLNGKHKQNYCYIFFSNKNSQLE